MTPTPLEKNNFLENSSLITEQILNNAETTVLDNRVKTIACMAFKGLATVLIGVGVGFVIAYALPAALVTAAIVISVVALCIILLKSAKTFYQFYQYNKLSDQALVLLHKIKELNVTFPNFAEKQTQEILEILTNCIHRSDTKIMIKQKIAELEKSIFSSFLKNAVNSHFEASTERSNVAIKNLFSSRTQGMKTDYGLISPYFFNILCNSKFIITSVNDHQSPTSTVLSTNEEHDKHSSSGEAGIISDPPELTNFYNVLASNLPRDYSSGNTSHLFLQNLSKILTDRCFIPTFNVSGFNNNQQLTVNQNTSNTIEIIINGEGLNNTVQIKIISKMKINPQTDQPKDGGWVAEVERVITAPLEMFAVWDWDDTPPDVKQRNLDKTTVSDNLKGITLT